MRVRARVCVCVCLHSLLLLSERVSIWRVTGTLFCICGLALIVVDSLSPSSTTTTSTHDTVTGTSTLPRRHLFVLVTNSHHVMLKTGYVFLFLSMIGFAVYSVLWAKIMRPISGPFDRTPILGLAGIGFIGLFTCGFMWLYVMHSPVDTRTRT